MHIYKTCLRHGDLDEAISCMIPIRKQSAELLNSGQLVWGIEAIDIAAVSCYGEAFFERFYRMYPEIKSMVELAKFYKGTFALQEALHGLNHRTTEKHLKRGIG